MKKHLCTLIFFASACAIQADEPPRFSYARKLGETMFVGDEWKVYAAYAGIQVEDTLPERATQAVVKLEQNKANQWTIIAEHPGDVVVVLEKAVHGYSTDKRRRVHQHYITVKPRPLPHVIRNEKREKRKRNVTTDEREES